MAPRARPKKTEYVNRTDGWLGAVVIDRKGDEKAIVVEPAGRVFLTDEEVELTGNAHASPSLSPFVPQKVVHRDLATGDVRWEGFVAPLTRAQDMPTPEEGARAEGEEVATPT